MPFGGKRSGFEPQIRITTATTKLYCISTHSISKWKLKSKIHNSNYLVVRIIPFSTKQIEKSKNESSKNESSKNERLSYEIKEK